MLSFNSDSYANIRGDADIVVTRMVLFIMRELRGTSAVVPIIDVWYEFKNGFPLPLGMKFMAFLSWLDRLSELGFLGGEEKGYPITAEGRKYICNPWHVGLTDGMDKHVEETCD